MFFVFEIVVTLAFSSSILLLFDEKSPTLLDANARIPFIPIKRIVEGTECAIESGAISEVEFYERKYRVENSKRFLNIQHDIMRPIKLQQKFECARIERTQGSIQYLSTSGKTCGTYRPCKS